MAADADNYRSLVWRDHYPIEDWEGKTGLSLSEAMADEAIRNITSHVSVSPDRPFMMFWAPVAMHSPHQAPPEYIEQYKGKFDMGWDKARETIHKKQLEMGVIPPGTKLTERTDGDPGLGLSEAEEQKLYARQMEVFAAMLTHVDEQIGRILEILERTGQLDNTLIFVTADNGSSAARAASTGTFNETYVLNGLQTPVRRQHVPLRRLGRPDTYPALPRGLGAGRQHAVPVLQADRPPRRHPGRAGHPLARRDQGQGRGPQPVPPHHRHRRRPSST